MRRPPKLEFKTIGVPVLEYKNSASPAGIVIEANDDTGVVEAYVAVTGTRDEVGDIIEPGSFIRTLKALRPKMCLGHDWNRPIGEPQEIEELAPGDPRLPDETADGAPWPAEAGALYTKNRYILGTQDGRDAYEHAKFYGPRTAYSIGYVVKRKRMGIDHRGRKTRYIQDVDLYEYGPVLHGAHSHARQRSVKTGEPDALEAKAIKKVRDASYWGYPVGTPISANMRPKGRPALALRKQGKVPSKDVGVTESDTVPGAGTGKRTPRARQAEADAAGLFPEPEAPEGARVRAVKPKGKDDEYTQHIVDNFSDKYGTRDPDEMTDPEDGDSGNPLDNLVDEGITPAELEEDLRETDWATDDVAGPPDQQEIDGFIEEVVASYRARYAKRAREQAAENAAGKGDAADASADKPVDGTAVSNAPASADAPDAVDGGVDKEPAAEPDKTTRAMWKANPDRAAQKMPGAQAEAYRALPPSAQDEYARSRIEGGDHETAMTAAAPTAAAATPGAPDEAAPDADKPVVDDVTPAAEPDAPEVDGAAPVVEPDAPAAKPEEPAADAPPVADASDGATPAGDLKPAEPTPAALISRVQMDPKYDLSKTSTADLKAADAEMTRRAELLGQPDAVTATHQRLKDEVAARNGEELPAQEATPSELPVSPSLGVGETGAPEGHAAAAPIVRGDIPTEPDKVPFTSDGAGKLTAQGSGWKIDIQEEGDGADKVYAWTASISDPANPDDASAQDSVSGRTQVLVEARGQAVSGLQNLDEGQSDDRKGTFAEPGAAPAEPVVATGDLSKIKSMSDEQLTAEAEKAKADFDAVRDQPRATNAYTEPKLYLDQITAEQQRRAGGGAIETPDVPSETGSGLEVAPDAASELAMSGEDVTPGVEAVNSPAPPALDKRGVIAAAYLGNAETIAPQLAASFPAAYDGTGETPETDAAALVAARVPAMELDDIISRNQRKQDAATGQEPSAVTEATETLNPATTAQLDAEDIAEANLTADASFGVTEADDGQFEMDADVADRQDRVASLLNAEDAGTLDLTGQTDDGLRSTRSDIVGEIKLQEHLATRERAGRAPAKRQQEDSGNDSATEDGTGTPPGPKVRPGVAGAAEDLADALEADDPDAITRARARLESSLKRSKSDSEYVGALRTLLESDADVSPEQLRAAADAIRLEARTRRNENARNRRTARRLDRERLRGLLGQVDSEMRRRNLDFDPMPGADSGAETSATGSTAGQWRANTAPIFSDGGLKEVSGTGYTGQIDTFGGVSKFEWSVVDPNGGTVTASGSGSMADEESARAAVAHALDVQQRLGRIPSDSILPTVPASDTAAQRLDAERSGIDAIRSRLGDPGVNPVTGVANPLTPPAALRPPRVPAFDSPQAVRAHLEARPVVINGVNTAQTIRWDDVKLSPGGGLAVATRAGNDKEPFIMHTGSGTMIRVFVEGRVPKLGKTDLMKVATLMESLPDKDGNVINFAEPERGAVAASLNRWMPPRGGDGYSGLMAAAMNEVVMDKIRAGRWSDPIVRTTNFPWSYGGTNLTRRDYLSDQHRNLGFLLDRGPRNKSKEDKATQDIANGARTLSEAGAPDAAAVVLRRRAAELREMESTGKLGAGVTADGRGAALLDDMANTHLSLYSPAASPGTRAVRVQPGERFAFAEDDSVRTYRVLTPMRKQEDDNRFGRVSAQVMDESTGQVMQAEILQPTGVTASLTISDASNGRSGPVQTTSLGGASFVVLDADQAAPDADGIKAAAFADAGAIPTEALDQAAELLPETKPEAAARRAAAPDGGRAPSRRSAAAPRRTAPEAVVAPTPDEQKLAEAQTRARNSWVTPVELADSPPGGGFEDFDGVIENAKKLIEQYPAYRDRRSTSAQAAYIQDPDSPASRSLPAGGAKLSPGGSLVYRKDGTIEQASTGLIIWSPTMDTRTTVETPSPALTARIADYFERAQIGGKTIPWSADGDAIREAVQGTHASTGKNPLGEIIRTAYADHLATTSRPTANDLKSFESMTGDVSFASVAPNPDVLAADLTSANKLERAYMGLSGKRMMSGDVRPSKTREGGKLAQRIASEYVLTRTQARVSPLDAVRRLERIADELDGREIESFDGEKFTPSVDLRARAQVIRDGYDDAKPSPMGMLGRNNFTGTVLPDYSKANISVGGTFYSQTDGYGRVTNASLPGASEGTRSVRTARLKTELREGDGIKLERNEEGKLRATLAGKTVDDGVGRAMVRTNEDGSIMISWTEDLHAGSGQPTVTLPPGTWKLDGGKPTAPGSTISDEEYAAHTASIEDKISAALADGQATDVVFTVGGDGQSWTPERAKLHNEIVDELWQTNGANVPREGRAVIAGGLGGAGKSTVLKGYAGIDANEFFTVNPDEVKEAMAARGMVPTIEGLSPMEASVLVHEESSHVANMLANRAYAERTNIVWDITMSRKASVEKRLAQMRKAGYTDVAGVFVDIPVETSVERATGRHRQGMEQAKAGEGNGGRYVPPAIIRQHSSDASSSANRDTFDVLTSKFDSWVIYDNSMSGREPQKVAGSGTWK